VTATALKADIWLSEMKSIWRLRTTRRHSPRDDVAHPALTQAPASGQLSELFEYSCA
jgi:hypothetical protein